MADNTTTVWYCVPDHDEATRFVLNVLGRFNFTPGWEFEMLAQQCAEDYHSTHGGWESSWPLVFVLYSEEEGPERGRFNVERESVPQFSARSVK